MSGLRAWSGRTVLEEPVLGGIADTDVARLFEWNNYFFFIPEPISIIPPPNKATPTAKNMKALCP